MNKKFTGVIVPMITPFKRNGEIDENAIIKIIENFIKVGVNPFILGTTGESASISDEEKFRFAQIVSKNFKGKTILYAGVGSNDIKLSVEYAKQYYDLGFDCCVAHLPSYYPITDSQILKYYENLIEQIPSDLMLYNIKATTHLSIPVDIVKKLSQHERIVGLKDSERDFERIKDLINFAKEKNDFSFLIGWGSKCGDGLLLGADGIVPSTGNITPGLFKEMLNAVKQKDINTVRKIQLIADEISEVYQKNKLLSESLAALKVMMETEQLCEKFVLPPLTEIEGKEYDDIRKGYTELIEKYELKNN